MDSSNAGILLLEDSRTQARLIASMFSEEGFDVETIYSPRELTSSPRLFELQITAALIDVHFGEVNGVDLIKPLMERWPGVVLVLMTANNTDDYSVLAKAKEAGADLVLRKPFNRTDVLEIATDIHAIRNEGQRRRHIVVIDDSKTTCTIASKLLSSYGYRVTAFQQAEDVLQRLNYDHVDAVLTDLNMPGMGGAELICLIRDIWQDVGVVAMSTGGEGVNGPAIAKRAGADFFVPKPFGPEELIGALEASMGDNLVYI